MTALLPILHEIDLRLGLDEALALRRVGRARRSARSRKGWITRRDRDGSPKGEDALAASFTTARASEGGIAQ